MSPAATAPPFRTVVAALCTTLAPACSCNPTAAEGSGSRPATATAAPGAPNAAAAKAASGSQGPGVRPPLPSGGSASTRADQPTSDAGSTPSAVPHDAASPNGAAGATLDPTRAPDTSAYGWHSDSSVRPLAAYDRLVDRFAPPAGFERVALEPGSFGAWLRSLPLAEPNTPVVAYDGRVILRRDDPRLAAVATLDVGSSDLQQCADAVMRLHAEWSWGAGRHDVSYRAASGIELPYQRWARGQRLHLEGNKLVWATSARPADDHPTFRRYLDAVFTWANTVSLSRQARTIRIEDLRPGDFFVLPGNPGHTVLVLDMARHSDGRRVVLLGQSYMPAQSYHVLRPATDEVWFPIEPQSEGLQTPFWPAPFPWTSIRRLDG